MLNAFAIAAVILLVVASTSAILLFRDVDAGRLRGRVSAIRSRAEEQVKTTQARMPMGIQSVGRPNELAVRLMHVLRFFPDIPHQNVISWKLVVLVVCAMALVGFFYGREFVGGPLAALAMPIEALLMARLIFGWERARYQKTLLEQLPDVMGLITRAVEAGIPLSEALRSVAREAVTPSREEFARVTREMAIGLPLVGTLWKLYERVGLPEYAFFAVTIGLQAQTGGSLVETLRNLQEMVRKRVALSKRGKALAAEARMSAIILGSLPVVIGIVLIFIRPNFLDFFLHTPSGNHLLLIACGLMGTGILVMRQLIRRSLAP